MYRTTPNPALEQKVLMENLGFTLCESTDHQNEVYWKIQLSESDESKFTTVQLSKDSVPEIKTIIHILATNAYLLGWENKASEIKKVLGIPELNTDVMVDY